MGGAPYIGPRLGDGLIFEVSVSQLCTKECPGKLPSTGSSALFKQSRARAAGYRADTSPSAINGSRIKWAWLRSLAVLCAEMRHKVKPGLVLRLFGRLFLDLTLII